MRMQSIQKSVFITALQAINWFYCWAFWWQSVLGSSLFEIGLIWRAFYWTSNKAEWKSERLLWDSLRICRPEFLAESSLQILTSSLPIQLGPISTWISRAVMGSWHSEHTVTGCIIWPHFLCLCNSGAPRSSAMCLSPQLTNAKTTGCKSNPRFVSRYSSRSGRCW